MSLNLDEPARRAMWILHLSVKVKIIPENAFVKIEKGNDPDTLSQKMAEWPRKQSNLLNIIHRLRALWLKQIKLLFSSDKYLFKKSLKFVYTHSKTVFKISIARMEDALKAYHAIISILIQSSCNRPKLISQLTFSKRPNFKHC